MYLWFPLFFPHAVHQPHAAQIRCKLLGNIYIHHLLSRVYIFLFFFPAGKSEKWRSSYVERSPRIFGILACQNSHYHLFSGRRAAQVSILSFRAVAFLGDCLPSLRSPTTCVPKKCPKDKFLMTNNAHKKPKKQKQNKNKTKQNKTKKTKRRDKANHLCSFLKGNLNTPILFPITVRAYIFKLKRNAAKVLNFFFGTCERFWERSYFFPPSEVFSCRPTNDRWGVKVAHPLQVEGAHARSNSTILASSILYFPPFLLKGFLFPSVRHCFLFSKKKQTTTKNGIVLAHVLARSWMPRRTCALLDCGLWFLTFLLLLRVIP